MKVGRHSRCPQNGAFHFDYWIVLLVGWKPVVDVNYPSKVTFWVRILDVSFQLWAEKTFQTIGDALGQVQGEVDLYEGQVRLELDGFKPLVFIMTAEFHEGVEIVVSLRYEKLFGFCRTCFRLTHDQYWCPSLNVEVEHARMALEIKLEQGSHTTSYKAAVANGKESISHRREGNHHHSKKAKELRKGKGIPREMTVSFRHEISF